MLSQFNKYKITYTLIGINIFAYVLSAFFSQSIIDIDIKVLVDMGALYGPITVLHNEWWRLISAMFLHGGMTHLLMNMFSLYLIGRGVEQYFNTVSYLSLYLFSGLLGGLASLYIHPDSVGIGASGAIFGIFGAMAGFFLAHREDIQSHTKAFMKDFAMILGINLVLGFSIPSIDVSAHVGGLIVGLLGGYIIAKNPKWVWTYSITMILVMAVIMNYLPKGYAHILM